MDVLLQERHRPPAQCFPEDAGTYSGSIRSLASRSSLHNGDNEPLEGPPLAEAGCALRHSAQKEGCHHRRFQQGLGSALRRQTDLRSLVRGGVGSAHQLPRDASSVPCLSILTVRHKGTHVLICSDSRSVVSYINHQSSLVSKRLCMLANDLLV